MIETQEERFQLKADLVPLTVIKLAQTNLAGIQQQLAETIKEAPNYFRYAPILIDINDIKQQAELDIAKLVAVLKEQQLIPVAIRGADEATTAFANAFGLAILKVSAEKTTSSKSAEANTKSRSPTKIITKPIRAGAQIYAKGGDLIVLSSVNAGAECFADGSIHVYGALRGRALAGASGDTEARIFCRSLEAELVAIAGHYQIKEDIKSPDKASGMVQIYLENSKLQINSI